MAIPQRAMQATCEISTGTLILGTQSPVYTGESYATAVTVELKNGGTAYSLPAGTLAEMYLYWPGTPNMTTAVAMEADGSTLTGTVTDEMTAVGGCPLLVLQLTDEATGNLIVAAAAPVRITNVRGDVVISSRAPSPSEIVYIGRAPYIGPDSYWYEWDPETREYKNSGTYAIGDRAGFGTPTATVDANVGTPSVSVTASGPDTAKVFAFEFHNMKGDQGETGLAAGFGTPTATVDANVGTPSVSVTASGPDTAKVFSFAFSNLKGVKGDTGPVGTVNSQSPDGSGNVVVSAEDVPSSAIDGDTDVDAALEDLATAYFTVDGNGVPYITFYEEV